MEPSDLPIISQFIENIQIARSLHEALDVLHGTAMDMGYQRVVYGRTRVVRHDKPLTSPAEILERGFPKNWRNAYEVKGRFDPYCRLSCETMRPANWSKINKNAKVYTKPVQDFISWTVNDLGMENGTTIPIRTSLTQYAIVSFIDFSGNDEITPSVDADMLSLVANYFVNQVTSYSWADIPDLVSLSKREEECLYWLGLGKSLDDIALILDISSETVRSYFKRVTYKLEASNRTQALAKALSLGLVDIFPTMMEARLDS